MSKHLLAGSAVALMFVFFSSPAQAALVDLRPPFFTADPSVTVASDGSSALMAEDEQFSPVLLFNDPGAPADPNTPVFFPAPGSFVSFSYDFVEPDGNDDEFGAFLLDPDTGDSLGAGAEFFTDTSSAGTVVFDLTPFSSFDYVGLQFELNAGFEDFEFDSTVLISDVRLAVVPEPATTGLFALGLGALAAARRRRSKRS